MDTAFHSLAGAVGVTTIAGSPREPGLDLGAAGDYRVRVHRRRHAGSDDMDFLLQFWPGAVAPPQHLRRGEPAVPAPAEGTDWSEVLVQERPNRGPQAARAAPG